MVASATRLGPDSPGGPGTVIRVELQPAALGRVRLAYSPMWELSQSLRVFLYDRASPGHSAWIRSVEPRLDRELVEFLGGLMPNPFWYPDFLSPQPGGRPRSLRQELAVIATMTPGDVRCGIAATSDGALAPDLERVLASDRAAVPTLVRALDAYWQQAVAPFWPRIRRVLAADLAFRADALAAHGLHETLNDLHPRVAFDGKILSLNLPRHEGNRRVGVDGLALLPCAFGWPEVLVVAAPPNPVTLAYPPRGVAALWEPDRRVPTDRPAALMGRNRAAILALLARPMNVSEVVEHTGLSAPAVSEHLSVLRDTGLVESRRSGRTVWSVRTRLGTEILSPGEH